MYILCFMSQHIAQGLVVILETGFLLLANEFQWVLI
jgi:hypothetical protein